jgi:Tol biopolymer transport system component
MANMFLSNHLVTKFTLIFLSYVSLCCIAMPSQANQLGFLSNQDGDIELYVSDASGQKLKQLTQNGFDDQSPCTGSDGKWLAYIGRNKTSQYIQLIDLTGKALISIKEADATYSALTCKHTEDTISYAEYKGKKYTVYTLNVTTKKVTEIYSSESALLNLTYSYDDKYLAFTQADKRKSFLVILDIKNKSTVRHFNDGKFLIATLDWSPIEHKIVLSAKYKRQFDLWLLDTSNGSAKQLTDLLTIDTDAKFSADGKKLYWLSARKDQLRLQLVLSDLSLRKLQYISADGIEIRDPIWSPKGNSLIYSAYTNNLFRLYEYRFDDKSETLLFPQVNGFQIMPFHIKNPH